MGSHGLRGAFVPLVLLLVALVALLFTVAKDRPTGPGHDPLDDERVVNDQPCPTAEVARLVSSIAPQRSENSPVAPASGDTGASGLLLASDDATSANHLHHRPSASSDSDSDARCADPVDPLLAYDRSRGIRHERLRAAFTRMQHAVAALMAVNANRTMMSDGLMMTDDVRVFGVLAVDPVFTITFEQITALQPSPTNDGRAEDDEALKQVLRGVRRQALRAPMISRNKAGSSPAGCFVIVGAQSTNNVMNQTTRSTNNVTVVSASLRSLAADEPVFAPLDVGLQLHPDRMDAGGVVDEGVHINVAMTDEEGHELSSSANPVWLGFDTAFQALKLFGQTTALVVVGGRHVVVIQGDDRMHREGGGFPEIYASAAALPTGTVLTLVWGDAGVSCIGTTRPLFAAALAERRPSLYWLSYNPCVLDPLSGVIAPHEIPVPPSLLIPGMGSNFPPHEADRPASDRRQRIVWRGGTTGGGGARWGSASTRGRVLHAFAERRQRNPQLRRLFRDAVDIKVAKLSQGVKRDQVPEGFLSYRGLEARSMIDAQLQLDLDGNTNAWTGLQWKLLSGSAVVQLRSRPVLWFHHRLVNGTNVLLYDTVDELVSAVIQLLRDYPQSAETKALLDRVGAGGRALAKQILTVQGVLAETRRAVLCGIPQYNASRDWRAQSG